LNHRKTLAIVGLVAVAALMVAGVVVGAATLTQHNTLNIVNPPPPPPSPNLALFSDQGAAVALSDPLDWSNIVIGTSLTKTYWIKNTGTGPATVTISTPTVAWGTVTTSPPSGFGLAAGAVQQVDVTVSISPTATAQAGVNFDVGFGY
jgi:archaellum component FlaG (FlaF/FlaG flagellin family)